LRSFGAGLAERTLHVAANFLAERRVPVTAKLSRDFYEHFGDKIVDELVGLLNLADAGYRTELREQNELNYARFEAKLEERFAQADAKLERRLGEVRAELREEISALDKKMEVGFANLKLSIEQTLREQTRWFIAAWGALIVAWAALVALNIGIWTRLP
jgi:hypothetical protein